MGAFNIRRKALPQPPPRCQRRSDVDMRGMRVTGDLAQAPSMIGELHEIRGLLVGIGCGNVDGSISILLHEKLVEVRGEVTVWGDETLYMLLAVQQKIERRLRGIASTAPDARCRYSAKYFLKWES